MTRAELKGTIQTVLGPIEPSALGRTLMRFIRDEAWKASAGQFEVLHAAHVESSMLNQQLVEQLAPGLQRQLGVDVAALTAAHRKAFENVAKAVKKQWP